MAKGRSTNTIKKTKLEQEYNRSYRNLRSRVKSQEKQGYFGFNMPARVKKPTQASINKLNKINAKYIREHSNITASPTTGEIVTPYELRKEQAHRRSESAKQAAKVRKKRINDNYDSFNNLFTDQGYSKNYIPNKQQIVEYNLLNDVISHVVPRDFFNELLEMVVEGRKEAQYNIRQNERGTTGRYGKQFIKSDNMREKSAGIIERKIRNIIYHKQVNKVYHEIINNHQKDLLMSSLDKSMYGYSEDEITEGRTTVLQILNQGTLSISDYSDLLAESDDEQ